MNQFGDPRLPVRFWAKVQPCPMSGCWLFEGRLDRKGYGAFDIGSHADSRSVRAHKYAYETLVAHVGDGLELDHRCRVRCCVNPLHLEPVTHRVNMSRGAHAMKTHCPNGHPYNETNTYSAPTRTKRDCRECRRAQSGTRTAEYRRLEYLRRKARRAA